MTCNRPMQIELDEILGQELERYSKIKTNLYIKKGFQGNNLKAAVDFAVLDMINELDSYAIDKVSYLKAENDDLQKYLDSINS